MTYLLDTNVVSELTRPKPERSVETWVGSIDEDAVFISAITVAEVRRGVRLQPVGQRRDRLDAWVRDELIPRFQGRLLSVDLAVADLWGDLMAGNRARGVTLGVLDGFIAATAAVHDLTLVTRNSRHFAACGVPLVNPWES